MTTHNISVKLMLSKISLFHPIKFIFSFIFFYFLFVIQEFSFMSKEKTKRRKKIVNEERKSILYSLHIQHTLHMANWFYYIIIHGSVAPAMFGVHGSLCVIEVGKRRFFLFHVEKKNAMASLFNVNGNFYEESFFLCSFLNRIWKVYFLDKKQM